MSVEKVLRPLIMGKLYHIIKIEYVERILVDMDNVLADFDGKLYADLAMRHHGLEKRERRNLLFSK